MSTAEAKVPKRVVCVGIVVVRDDGRVLWIRQARGHSLEGQWSIPWGIVDTAESPAEAAAREAREEAGVEVRVEGLLGVQDLPESNWLALAFLARHVAGEPTPDGRETDRAEYLSASEMDEKAEPFEPWCAWLVRRVLSDDHHVVPHSAGHPFEPSRGFS